MKIFTGIDIIYLPRFKKLVEDPAFVERVFSLRELDNQDIAHLAGLFAVKEAFFKATQIKIRKWHEIEVLTNKSGKPYLQFEKSLLEFEIQSLDLSISHDQDYVVGNVVILTGIQQSLS